MAQLLNCQRNLVGTRIVQRGDSLLADEHFDLLRQIIKIAGSLVELRSEHLEVPVIDRVIEVSSLADIGPRDPIQHNRHIVGDPGGPPQTEEIAATDQPCGNVFFQFIYRFIDQEHAIRVHECLPKPRGGLDVPLPDGGHQYPTAGEKHALSRG